MTENKPKWSSYPSGVSDTHAGWMQHYKRRFEKVKQTVAPDEIVFIGTESNGACYIYFKKRCGQEMTSISGREIRKHNENKYITVAI